MDTYLEIAERVLKAVKRPMTARGILDAAYRAKVVPSHLYGKTQHKTLQARLSEDILHFRSNSKFFRTDPGIFFLSNLVSDPTVPEKFKHPFSARRRTRDLMKEPALAFEYGYFKSERFSSAGSWIELVRDAEKQKAIKFVDPRHSKNDYVLVWSFSLVRRLHYALSYKIGRYRDDRDHFANRRTIGFPGLVNLSNQSLFSMDDYGASDCALETVLLDLDLSREAFSGSETLPSPSPIHIVSVDDENSHPNVLLVMEWKCPDWFEPTTRRLSLNEPMWWDIAAKPNNLDDFESWSVAALEAMLSVRPVCRDP